MAMAVVRSVLYPIILFASACAFAPRRRRNPFLAARPQSTVTATAAPVHNSSITRHDDLLWGMARFFGEDMVDSRTRRFYYACHPIEGECRHAHFPIRDLAAAWDASKALEFTKIIREGGLKEEASVIRVQRRLTDGIRCTLSYYLSNLEPIDDASSGLCPSKGILLEPPTIAHSALLLLAVCDSLRSSVLERGDETLKAAADGLAQGILSMQMESGAFEIEFPGGGGDHLRGIAFYPGEAMLSLMSVHEICVTSGMPEVLEESTRGVILPAVGRAFGFYSRYYYAEDADVNFNIWQVLAFAKYHDALSRDRMAEKEEVEKYILDMCRGICESKSWKHQLARGRSFYVNLETVEIACGLDALAEGIRIARERGDIASIASLFEVHATNALQFLEWAQEQVPEGLGKGGLGYGGTQVFEQRLDVTGHAVSALVKLRNMTVALR